MFRDLRDTVGKTPGYIITFGILIAGIFVVTLGVYGWPKDPFPALAALFAGISSVTFLIALDYQRRDLKLMHEEAQRQATALESQSETMQAQMKNLERQLDLVERQLPRPDVTVLVVPTNNFATVYIRCDGPPAHSVEVVVVTNASTVGHYTSASLTQESQEVVRIINTCTFVISIIYADKHGFTYRLDGHFDLNLSNSMMQSISHGVETHRIPGRPKLQSDFLSGLPSWILDTNLHDFEQLIGSVRTVESQADGDDSVKS